MSISLKGTLVKLKVGAFDDDLCYLNQEQREAVNCERAAWGRCLASPQLRHADRMC